MAKKTTTNDAHAADAADLQDLDGIAQEDAQAELAEMMAADRNDPDFDHKRFWALHYLADGQPVPRKGGAR